MINPEKISMKLRFRHSGTMIYINSFLTYSILILLVNCSTGLKWVTINPGDSLPPNTIRINDGQYIGRARHFDEILIATVNSTAAVVSSCGNIIAKRYYDVLVSRTPCYWEKLTEIEKVSENIVHAGTASNGEPIYVGRSTRVNLNVYSIESIYLFSKLKNRWLSNNIQALVCNQNIKWIDTSAANIPIDSVLGGISPYGKRQYVARVKRDCTIVPGGVIPDVGIASAFYDGEPIESIYCQVLVGGKNEYTWESSLNGQIPDYAVVGSKDRNGELMYIARVNSTLGYLTHSSADNFNGTYEILVKDQKYADFN